MVKLNTKVKGFTLVETLVTLVIIMISLGIGLFIYLNVTQFNNLQKKLDASVILNDYSIQTKNTKKYIDETIELGSFIIQKKIISYKDYPNLFLLQLIISDKSKKEIIQQMELVRIYR